jgi:hypothetical protein
MRWLAILPFLSLPALAWEFSPMPVCTLRSDAGAAEVVVTFDPSLPEYAISITLADGVWAEAPVFSITFLGAASATISTNRHVLSPDRSTLTVTDRGFDNVLNGLEFNGEAVATAGETIVRVTLDGAGAPVRAFRGCPATTLS